MAKIIEITDLSIPELDAYARLTQAQLRNRLEPEKGIFIAESPKVIDLALKAGCTPISFLMERKHIEGQAADLIAQCDVPVYTADRDVLASLTGYELTRGILCALRRPQLPCPGDVLRTARRVAVLCGIVDVFIGGFQYAVTKWISGIPFDISHCVGNFFIALVMFNPLRKLLEQQYKKMMRQ